MNIKMEFIANENPTEGERVYAVMNTTDYMDGYAVFVVHVTEAEMDAEDFSLLGWSDYEIRDLAVGETKSADYERGALITRLA